MLSFVLDGYRTEEVGAALNQEGIAVRSGHHCAQPILRRFGVEATVRPSLAFYNTCRGDRPCWSPRCTGWPPTAGAAEVTRTAVVRTPGSSPGLAWPVRTG